VVLFLGATPPALPYLVGLGQGVFRVQRDPRTGATSVTPPALLANPVRNVRVTRGDPLRRPMTVGQFADTVRQALSAPASDQRAPLRAGERAPAGGPERTVKKIP
jgi:hypothetical protein